MEEEYPNSDIKDRKLHITPSFKETDQHMYLEGSETDEKSQVFREFKTQAADFESKESSETASEGN